MTSLAYIALTAPDSFAGALSVETQPAPQVGQTVLRETKPLSGTSAAQSEIKLPPSQAGTTAPSVAPPPPVTPDGRIIAGSTNLTKTEEKLQALEAEAANASATPTPQTGIPVPLPPATSSGASQ